MMRSRSIIASGALLVAGCTSGNSAIEPPYQSTNISHLGTLQFVVGTANIAQSSGSPVVGLNTVVTFRKATGGSASAVNSPQIVGPSGFTIPASSGAYADAGTNTINSNAQTAATQTTTFGTAGEATLYGFGPNNYGTSGTPNYGTYPLPFYADLLTGTDAMGAYDAEEFNGLPPAFPAPPYGTGFTGYNLGFVPFAATAVSGTYALNVTIPTTTGASQSPYTYTASAVLNAAKVLPALAPPVLTLDSTGTGGSLAATFPAGVSEIVVELTDVTASSQATYVFTTAAAGAQSVSDGTIATAGDTIVISAIGCDYDAFALAAPANTAQTPALPAQADVTLAVPQVSPVPTSSSSAARRSIKRLR